MENAEEVYHYLEEFSKRKPKTIPQELNEYLAYVARTGDPVYQWSLVKSLFKEKLLNVITDFYETSPGIDIPPYPNVDTFNFDIMKNSLLERFDTFTSAPFTVQRICELLTCPRKQYNRVDKFMRAIEKNILVVSTREPGIQRHPEPENGEPREAIVNGSDNNSEYNVDVEMEDMSWKDSSDQQNCEPQPGSSDSHISADDIEARLNAKQNTSMDIQEKTEYESVTPPEPNVVTNDEQIDVKTDETPQNIHIEEKMETSPSETCDKPKIDTEIKAQSDTNLVIPEIQIDDVEMTEHKLKEKSNSVESPELSQTSKKDHSIDPDSKVQSELTADENSSDSKEETESKLISEVSTSSEESSSSDNTDGNSNSPKPDVHEESNQSESSSEYAKQEDTSSDTTTVVEVNTDTPKMSLESDNYSISDVNSVLPQPQVKDNQEVVQDTPKVQENLIEENKEESSLEIETVNEQVDESITKEKEA